MMQMGEEEEGEEGGGKGVKEAYMPDFSAEIGSEKFRCLRISAVDFGRMLRDEARLSEEDEEEEEVGVQGAQRGSGASDRSYGYGGEGAEKVGEKGEGVNQSMATQTSGRGGVGGGGVEMIASPEGQGGGGEKGGKGGKGTSTSTTDQGKEEAGVDVAVDVAVETSPVPRVEIVLGDAGDVVKQSLLEPPNTE